jgi:hypothetical protein
LRRRSTRLSGDPSELNHELRNTFRERVNRSLGRPRRRKIETV